MGLIDEVLTGEDVESSAIAYAQELHRTSAPLNGCATLRSTLTQWRLDSLMKPGPVGKTSTWADRARPHRLMS